MIELINDLVKVNGEIEELARQLFQKNKIRARRLEELMRVLQEALEPTRLPSTPLKPPGIEPVVSSLDRTG